MSTNLTATIETKKGNINLNLFEEKAPVTVLNFVNLSERGYYNGLSFHRVIDNFMIQGGCPDGTGAGSPGYQFEDEFDSSLSNVPGTIAMANAGPNTGGSQFFINLVNNNFLDSKHPVFGKVVKGMEIVEKIGKTRTAQADQPVEDVIIEKVIIK